jgi:hypothetical protein
MPPTACRFASADRCAHRQTRRRILIVVRHTVSALLVFYSRMLHFTASFYLDFRQSHSYSRSSSRCLGLCLGGFFVVPRTYAFSFLPLPHPPLEIRLGRDFLRKRQPFIHASRIGLEMHLLFSPLNLREPSYCCPKTFAFAIAIAITTAHCHHRYRRRFCFRFAALASSTSSLSPPSPLFSNRAANVLSNRVFVTFAL